VLWVDHGLAVSEQLAAPPAVFDAAVERIAKRVEHQRQQKEAADFQEITQSMHEQLRSGG
jgi:hypothetical protein